MKEAPGGDPLDRFGERTIAEGSQSFAKASKLFDRQTRRSALQLYAWCRHGDDAIDGQSLGHDAAPMTAEERSGKLAELKARTLAAMRGSPDGDPVFRSLADVTARHGLEERHALALLDGFALDVDGFEARNFDDVLRYSYHVAGVVGVMMARIMGVTDPAVLDRACDLGIAFQLTNIARDLVADAEAGRCYLPADWLREKGLTRANHAAPEHRDALHRLGVRLISEAEPYYASARAGIGHLPYRSAWAIASAHHIYRAIGTRLIRRGPEAWGNRISTSKLTKTGYVAYAALEAAWRIARVHRAPERDLAWQRPA